MGKNRKVSFKDLTALLCKVSKKQEIQGDIDHDTKISDIAIDSLTFIKLIIKFETEFDIEIDDDNLDFTQYKTVGALFNLVNSNS